MSGEKWYRDRAELRRRYAAAGYSVGELSARTGTSVRTISRHLQALRKEDSIPKIETVDEPWGLGRPAVLHLPPNPGGDYLVAGIFDLHGEHREKKLYEAQLRVLAELKPDLVILGGDGRNFDLISRWQTDRRKRFTPLDLQRHTERENNDYIKHVYHRIRNIIGDTPFIEVEGNHDDRWRKFMTDDLHEGWEAQKEFFRVNEYLNGYYTRAGVFIRPRFLVRHGDKLGQYPAASEYRASRCSGWSGHVHNAHVHFEKPYPLSGERFIHTIAPASCRLDTNYGSGNAGLMTWHQGMLIGTFSADDPHDHVTDIGLWNGSSLLLRGERY